VKLIIEPTDGVGPLLSAIKSAKKSVEIAIFRFDRTDIETALKTAVARGVKVTALIAFATAAANNAAQARAALPRGRNHCGSHL
jgi:phosphatidylserine/phosphatidylglycerophosphate/cardiolipin synthase-like enzyme